MQVTSKLSAVVDAQPNYFPTYILYYLICAVVVTVNYKQTMPFSAAHGRRTQVIRITVGYTHIEVRSLDNPAKGVTLETGVF